MNLSPSYTGLQFLLFGWKACMYMHPNPGFLADLLVTFNDAKAWKSMIGNMMVSRPPKQDVDFMGLGFRYRFPTGPWCFARKSGSVRTKSL